MLSLPQKGRKVLGPDLNCSESTWGAADVLPCCHPNHSTHDTPGDRCTAGFRPASCLVRVKLDRVGRGVTSIHVRSTPNTDCKFTALVSVSRAAKRLAPLRDRPPGSCG